MISNQEFEIRKQARCIVEREGHIQSERGMTHDVFMCVFFTFAYFLAFMDHRFSTSSEHDEWMRNQMIVGMVWGIG